MRVAVASGKGGTGKTTLAVAMASWLDHSGGGGRVGASAPFLLDCDVEAPDAHLFLRPKIHRRIPVSVPVPSVDKDRCVMCGDCAAVCRFNALAILGGEVLVLPELCHGCGSCVHVCQSRAMGEIHREIGFLEGGEAGGIQFAHGVLNVGEAMPVPVIRQLKKWHSSGPDQFVILDAPPGTSCPMVETLAGADFILLVTEPTPFGLHDLKLAVEVARELSVPMGVVINRDGIGDDSVETYCSAERIPVLMKIPFHRGIAEGLATGRCLLEVRPDLMDPMGKMIERIKE